MAHKIDYVLLNGPPECGKSTIGPQLVSTLSHHFSNVSFDSFAAPMKQYISTALAYKYMEMKKDSPMAILQGYSVREFLIDLSENYMKPRYGEDIFGRLLHYRMLRLSPLPAFVICDDCGFEVERDALPSPTVVQILRPGKDYRNDSRNYLTLPDYTLLNDGTLSELHAKVNHLAAWLVHRREHGKT